MDRDLTQLSERLRAHVPGIGDARLERVGEGDFCVAYAAGERWIVRVAKHGEAARALGREACVLPVIAHRLPLPVPRPRHFADPGGLAFSVHERVPGVELTRRAWEALPAAERERAAAEVAGFLAALHSADPAAGEACGLERLDAAWLCDVRDRARARLHALLPAGAAARVEAAFAAHLADPRESERPLVLLHRDVAPGHVLYDPASGRVTGVIDFGDIALGDPARDFIFFYEDFGTALLSLVLDRYGREPREVLLPRLRFWYLAETVHWTLCALEGGRRADVAEGVAEIAREAAAVVDGTEHPR
ncbi:MAG TPA: aminoglycoside phosphotransferase family protein [Longimicrobium sp.]|jgi:aminoglycoside phosphotransferase (APT) family kinase protein